MSQLVVLNLGTGDWHQGCASVVAQLWLSDQTKPTQCYGSLPPAPELGELLSRWQQLYLGLCTYKNWQSLRHNSFDIEIDTSDITHVSDVELKMVCQQLGQALNGWLDADSFRSIDRQLRTRLSHTDEVRFVVTAADRHFLELPWFLWQFFEDFPQAEPALSLPEYSATQQRQVNLGDPGGNGEADRVKILAILGNAQGIDLTEDQQTLKQLPNADVQFLVEPGLPELTRQLWNPGLNVLFFAGHSSSRCEGRIQVNATNALTLDQLRYGLKRAIAHGLQLAIFNSCDGVKLAWDLADLQIPIVIVMRAAVPNPVAQAFLKSFLAAFAGGHSLYSAVRMAREQLQGLEAEFPCASWLPVIYQNPAESPPRWQEWLEGQSSRQAAPAESGLTVRTAPDPAKKRSIRQPLSALLLSSLVVTGAMLGVRSLGWMQSLELWAFDRLLTLRPLEQPDSRLLVITIDDADIQAQNPEQRRGSLSDAALEQLLDQLKELQPSVIGLDIYRDFPVLPEHPRLAAQLRQNRRFIAVCKVSDAALDPTGTLPPPEVPVARLGFSDALRDSDGILRRHLLAMTPPPASACTTPYSLGARMAFLYLRQQGITLQFTAEGNLKLGNTVLPRLHSRSNGYQGIDARGNQVLLNYRALRSPRDIAPQVTLTQFLQGKVAASAVRDRIVLIGVTAASSGDKWTTPYGSGRDSVPGVFVQAHVISQLLSATLDQRPPLRVWSLWGEWLWIGLWSAVGGCLIGVGPLSKGTKSPLFTQWCLAGMVGLGSLTGLGWFLMIHGYWVPLIPPAVGLLATSGLVARWGDRSRMT